jgi:hypothetical protein
MQAGQEDEKMRSICIERAGSRKAEVSILMKFIAESNTENFEHSPHCVCALALTVSLPGATMSGLILSS